MKYIFTLILIQFINLNFAQNLIIDYTSTINANQVIFSTNINYKLILNDENKNSAYFNDNNDGLDQFKYNEFINEKIKKNDITRVKLSDNHYGYIRNDYFFKDYVDNKLIYNDIISTKKVIISEKLDNFNWEIIPKSDTLILNFKCQKAITKFRGRTYEAFFTSELGTFGGPWKFDGLPGVILSVKSLDNYFAINPVKIIINNKEKIDIENIYKDSNIISWEEYKNEFKANMEKRLKLLKSKSENGETGSIKITEKIEDLEIPEMKF
jgi:GLPGLI family protein